MNNVNMFFKLLKERDLIVRNDFRVYTYVKHKDLEKIIVLYFETTQKCYDYGVIKPDKELLNFCKDLIVVSFLENCETGKMDKLIHWTELSKLLNFLGNFR